MRQKTDQSSYSEAQRGMDPTKANPIQMVRVSCFVGSIFCTMNIQEFLCYQEPTQCVKQNKRYGFSLNPKAYKK